MKKSQSRADTTIHENYTKIHPAKTHSLPSTSALFLLALALHGRLDKMAAAAASAAAIDPGNSSKNTLKLENVPLPNPTPPPSA